MTARIRLTDGELCLAEQYASVLDMLSRCAKAIEQGNTPYLRDKARQLERAAAELVGVADDIWQQASDGGPRPRPEALRAAIAKFGRHYQAGRLLHPLGPDVPEVDW